MMSTALPRGPLVNLVLPGAANRPSRSTRRGPASVAYLVAGAALAALGLWLAAVTYAGGTLSLGGVSFGSRTFASDALMAVAFAYLLALATRFAAGSLARDVSLVAAGTLLLALCAQIIVRLPFTPVPITGQTFAVLVVGAALGWRRGVSSVLMYVGLGAAGLPIFADVSSPASLGYLAGFALAALVVGLLAERGWDRRLDTCLLAMLVGEVAIYCGGLPWLAYFVGWHNVLALGLIPFIPGDAVKLAVAALVLPAAWYVTGRTRERSEHA